MFDVCVGVCGFLEVGGDDDDDSTKDGCSPSYALSEKSVVHYRCVWYIIRASTSV